MMWMKNSVDPDQLTSDGSAQFSKGPRCKKTWIHQNVNTEQSGVCKQQRYRPACASAQSHSDQILKSIISRLATSEVLIF